MHHVMRRFIGPNRTEVHPRMIINRHMQPVIARFGGVLATITRDAASWPRKARQFLGVEMQKLTRCFSLMVSFWRRFT